jgi:hypothetical protein
MILDQIKFRSEFFLSDKIKDHAIFDLKNLKNPIIDLSSSEVCCKVDCLGKSLMVCWKI